MLGLLATLVCQGAPDIGRVEIWRREVEVCKVVRSGMRKEQLG
jgi:hypothetical protein